MSNLLLTYISDTQAHESIHNNRKLISIDSGQGWRPEHEYRSRSGDCSPSLDETPGRERQSA
jgi:hypothetical protein